eukprot:299219-Chlamydomonas_euryale.AAC.4
MGNPDAYALSSRVVVNSAVATCHYINLPDASSQRPGDTRLGPLHVSVITEINMPSTNMIAVHQRPRRGWPTGQTLKVGRQTHPNVWYVGDEVAVVTRSKVPASSVRVGLPGRPWRSWSSRAAGALI